MQRVPESTDNVVSSSLKIARGTQGPTCPATQSARNGGLCKRHTVWLISLGLVPLGQPGAPESLHFRRELKAMKPPSP
jgi:hypothetical protein